MWHADSQVWSEYPKAHSAQFLAIGQKLLYKAADVYDMPQLDAFQELVAPVIVLGVAASPPGVNTSTGAPVVRTPTRRRSRSPPLPSLLAHATHHNDIPSSSPRAHTPPSPAYSNGYNRHRFTASPSPDFPDALELVRRHWASNDHPINQALARGSVDNIAGPSNHATPLGKRRASSPLASSSGKRARVKLEHANHTTATAAKSEAIVPGGIAEEVIEVSYDEDNCVEWIDGREYIVISDDE